LSRALELTRVSIKQMYAMRPILAIIRPTTGLRAAVEAIFQP
jgi:hypothetical protein